MFNTFLAHIFCNIWDSSSISCVHDNMHFAGVVYLWVMNVLSGIDSGMAVTICRIIEPNGSRYLQKRKVKELNCHVEWRLKGKQSTSNGR